MAAQRGGWRNQMNYHSHPRGAGDGGSDPAQGQRQLRTNASKFQWVIKDTNSTTVKGSVLE